MPGQHFLMNPYEPPKGEIVPPVQITPAPKDPQRDERRQYALGAAAIGVAILARLAWEQRADGPEAAIGSVCLLVGLGVLWRLRPKRKP